MTRFAGRSVIVTGAAQGIGTAYARALAAEGAKVVVADLNTERGKTTADTITADGGTVIFAPVDVPDPESATTLAELTVTEFGGIDHCMGTPQDLVGACLYLLSDDASWVTGQIFNIDGGQVFRS
ncbi:SDR family oxidoreductase [Nocardia arizonensis]|uniref:SDR family oxidoreductase n=1 Tax=Nocardia arizonensis TaxID=1141647 RepID=UPI0007A754F5|nr:SDR family oxidoreductase [Nocardia arizonensis]